LELPEVVVQALRRAQDAGFGLSCEPVAGALLATLAAAVPPRARVLELGTGSGVSLAWITHGLRGRADVSVISVERDERIARIAAASSWPAWVDLRVGDAVALLPGLGSFDLIFADAQGGKWIGLDLTVAALRERGVLVVDDMDPALHQEHEAAIDSVRRTLLSDGRLMTADLPAGSGLMVAAKREGSTR
jgi:demethylmenaquinone methyltransferase/2-methoxy-6-polyprenyl-1,4-benzoquinol methylase